MSGRTTAVLFILVLLLGGFIYFQNQAEEADPATPTPVPTVPRIELMPEVNSEQVVRLELHRFSDDYQVVLSREEGHNWYQTVPTRTLIVSQTMSSVLASLVNVTSRRSFDAEQNPLSAYGLDQPTYELAVSIEQGEGEPNARFTFIIGDQTPTGEGFYLQRRGSDRVHIALSRTIQNVLDLLEAPPRPTPTPEPAILELEETPSP